MRLREGKGELNLWLTLRDFAPVALTTDSDLRDVRIDGAPIPGMAAPQLQLQRLQARLRWQRQAEGWALQVPQLRLKNEDGEQRSMACSCRSANSCRSVPATCRPASHCVRWP
ncbi:hypothetical protein AR276_13935 [Stenotrophomonas maltophilia]|nr:hypothetical protein AR276_13935 [Stenotrophomonas maltophilia]